MIRHVAFVLTLGLAQGAAAGTSSPSEVAVLPGGLYEVTPQKSRATSDFWCAIGSYAQAQLGLPAGQQVYVWRGRAPGANGRTAVRFGLPPRPRARRRA